MKVTHGQAWTEEDLAMYRPLVYRNVLGSIQAFIQYIQDIGLQWEVDENRSNADMIIDCRIDAFLAQDASSGPPPNVIQAMGELGNDPIVQTIMEQHGSEFGLVPGLESAM
jgi:guanine nucleotide-binding protein G(i) subunit alpha